MNRNFGVWGGTGTELGYEGEIRNRNFGIARGDSASDFGFWRGNWESELEVWRGYSKLEFRGLKDRESELGCMKREFENSISGFEGEIGNRNLVRRWNPEPEFRGLKEKLGIEILRVKGNIQIGTSGYEGEIRNQSFGEVGDIRIQEFQRMKAKFRIGTCGHERKFGIGISMF
jgi:hypothetical protein